MDQLPKHQLLELLYANRPRWYFLTGMSVSYGLIGNEAVAAISAYEYSEGFVQHEAYPVQ